MFGSGTPISEFLCKPRDFTLALALLEIVYFTINFDRFPYFIMYTSLCIQTKTVQPVQPCVLYKHVQFSTFPIYFTCKTTRAT